MRKLRQHNEEEEAKAKAAAAAPKATVSPAVAGPSSNEDADSAQDGFPPLGTEPPKQDAPRGAQQNGGSAAQAAPPADLAAVCSVAWHLSSSQLSWSAMHSVCLVGPDATLCTLLGLQQLMTTLRICMWNTQ